MPVVTTPLFTQRDVHLHPDPTDPSMTTRGVLTFLHTTTLDAAPATDTAQANNSLANYALTWDTDATGDDANPDTGTDVGESFVDVSGRDASSYPIYVPLSSLVALSRVTPLRNTPYLTLEVKLGDEPIAFPPMHFHSGGLGSLLAKLESVVFLTPDPAVPGRTLVNGTASDLLVRSLDALDLSYLSHSADPVELPEDAVSPDRVPSPSPSPSPPSPSPLQPAPAQSSATTTSAQVKPSLFGALSKLGGKVGSFVAKSVEGVIREARQASVASYAAVSSEIRNDGELGTFELVSFGVPVLDDSFVDTTQRAAPLSLLEFHNAYASVHPDGRLVDDEAAAARLRDRIFAGGLEPEARPRLWPFVLGLCSMTQPSAVVDAELVQRRNEYEALRSQWASISEAQEANWDKLRERKHRIYKDVVRTDRTHPFFAGNNNPSLDTMQSILMSYTFFNWNLGYVQGMSDLLAPIMVVHDGDEALSFWVFERLMSRMSPNFEKDQLGMHSQLSTLANLVGIVDPQLYQHFEATGSLNLFFCFRWILCAFKRELSFDDTMRLWEVMWSDSLTTQWHLFVALGILLAHRDVILDAAFEFDQTLKYINDLSGTLDVDAVIRAAHTIFLKLSARYADSLDDLIPPYPLLSRC